MNWYKQQKNAGKVKDFAKGFLGGVGIGLPLALLGTDNIPKFNNNDQNIPIVETQTPSPYKKENISNNNVKIDINKIIKIESSNNPNAVSPVGATGVMQIMPKTWNELVKKMGKNYSINDIKDRTKNIEVGSYYMNNEIPRLLNAYNIPDSVETRLAAYNWGIGALNQAYQNKGSDWLEDAPLETKNYIKKYKN